MSKLRAEIKQTDNGYELILFGAAFQGLKKEIVREADESGIKYNFRKEGFDLIAMAFSGIYAAEMNKAAMKRAHKDVIEGDRKDTKKVEEPKPEVKSKAIEVKPEDVQPEEVVISAEDSKPVQKETKPKARRRSKK